MGHKKWEMICRLVKVEFWLFEGWLRGVGLYYSHSSDPVMSSHQNACKVKQDTCGFHPELSPWCRDVSSWVWRCGTTTGCRAAAGHQEWTSCCARLEWWKYFLVHWLLYLVHTFPRQWNRIAPFTYIVIKY